MRRRSRRRKSRSSATQTTQECSMSLAVRPVEDPQNYQLSTSCVNTATINGLLIFSSTDAAFFDENLQMSWRTRNRVSNLCSTTRRHTRNTAKQRATGGPARTVSCGRGGEWLQRRCECFQSRFDGATSTGRGCYTVILCSLHPDITVFSSSGQSSTDMRVLRPVLSELNLCWRNS